MRDVRVAGSIRDARPDATLFERIGAFLDEQKLSPDPAHYAFAYAVLSAPESQLAAQVAALTAGRRSSDPIGYRATRRNGRR